MAGGLRAGGEALIAAKARLWASEETDYAPGFGKHN